MKFNLGQTLIVKAQKLTYEGYGEYRINNFPIFIENLLPNEEAKIILKQINSKYAFAEVLERYSDSPIRNVNIYNENLLNSGSAMLMHLKYDEQIKFKQNIVNTLFLRELNYLDVLDIIPSPKIWNYRNKISLQIGQTNDKEFRHGFYKKRSHDLVDQSSYDLADENLNKMILDSIQAIKTTLKNNNWIKRSKVFEITFKYSSFLGESQIVLHSLNEGEISDEFIKLIQSKWMKISIISNVYNKNYKFIKTKILANNLAIDFKMNDLVFSVNSDAFYQINEWQTQKIYSDIFSLISNDEIVLDAFSGVSSIGIFISKKAKKVISVEINKASTESAKINLKINEVKNLDIVNQDVKNFLLESKNIFNTVVVDPPRSGLDKEVINSFINSNISKIVYLSCNPRTLVRDIKNFTAAGYHIKYVRPYDMFPQTPHIETLVLLEKNII
ncbi:23S rRNA (uracil(1939)-C(5))-methyltransferase RlmD [[Mycoplasma] phocae]|uniref:23S rRNA (Uracil(1939)-C(5))-methyltransferase RlmD n=1 Tax=[Mycoplasma] phocae TaxID=142651 RepID=A0A2Z5IQJ5_9BACT|nr:23S rRNA (uracil(1939)-C(5))-methyltransferase RlmD [[Mycoplasma] phocae]AXE61019.1 23S rRNA (uracil(1939)-C(5))-methyltransferase RlmD [[Mycoplasma] phocae]